MKKNIALPFLLFKEPSKYKINIFKIEKYVVFYSGFNNNFLGRV